MVNFMSMILSRIEYISSLWRPIVPKILILKKKLLSILNLILFSGGLVRRRHRPRASAVEGDRQAFPRGFPRVVPPIRDHVLARTAS